MLASILPGIRYVRTPLTAGFIWLGVVWLLWGRHLPSAREATGLVRDVYSLADQLGRPVVIGGLSVTAYLVGEIWISVKQTVLVLHETLHSLLLSSTTFVRTTTSTFWGKARPDVRLLRSLSTDEEIDGDRCDLVRRLGVRPPLFAALTEDEMFGMHRALLDDMRRARTLMLDEAPELRAEHSRHLEESRFRYTIALPAATLLFTGLLVQFDLLSRPRPFPIAGLAAVAILVWMLIRRTGGTAYYQAWGVMLDAVDTGRIPATEFTEFGLRAFGAVDAPGQAVGTPPLPRRSDPDRIDPAV